MSHKSKASKASAKQQSHSQSDEDSSEDTKVKVQTTTTKSKTPAPKKAVPSDGENKSDSVGPPVGNFRYKQVNPENIDISELKKEGQQDLAYLNYNDSSTKQKRRILVQTGKIKMTAGGIPQLDSEREKAGQKTFGNYPSNEKREFIKIPLDPSQPPCMELKEFLTTMDEYFGSDEMKNRVFGKKNAGKYMYMPCVKPPMENDDENDDDDEDGGKNPRVNPKIKAHLKKRLPNSICVK